MTPSILILQSASPIAMRGWQGRCMASVRDWAQGRGYEYLCVGDELFECVPDWYMQKVGDRLAIAADYARLIWMRDLLAGAHLGSQPQCVAWLDADVLVFAPERFALNASADCLFGREHWLTAEGYDDNSDVQSESDSEPYSEMGQPPAASDLRQTPQGVRGRLSSARRKKLKVHKNVHNALAMFDAQSPTLPFLAHTVLRLMSRVDAQFIAPQFVGPKLLTSLHNTVGFETTDSVGAISPLLTQALLENDFALLDYYSSRLEQPMVAANLCASLLTRNEIGDAHAQQEQVKEYADGAIANRLIDTLLEMYGDGIG